ncbi:tripartite tricarboxylate transporter substrate binding protein [Acidovorax sp. SUPP2522]|uniref:Bug family tripartite tricarboxylate transporter substrate binding protein n=1 Tax=unclassified Acidovorax TaxID=2684926 RepID=UPI00234BDFA0|nr:MULTISPECIES: tripartite tricarboxylate transporter substrate binding protein [unclassified Acidovorax]WCM99630.1 tripartite tricarboxylate transporter substrate binding protein [Acidovorax sp. GBBC 1281]GKT19076.1 tripartite tricarboxylate transporter substrate binding protein [Acidovorax sp. SUPP2522]
MTDFHFPGITRRGFVAGGAGLAALSGSRASFAAAFPDRPIRLVVPYPAGGSTDIVARLVAKQLGEAIKGNVVVDNKGGAAGAIGSSDVARSAADGYTLLANIVTSAVIMPITQGKNLAYDPVAAFQPVAMVCKLPNVLVVNNDIPARTLKEFAAWARAHPSRASYGTGGTGSVMHLTGELLKRDGKFSMVHVPYRGAAPALQDLMAGNVAAVLDNITGVMGAIRAGSVRAIGVSTEHRSVALPDVPTFAESGVPGFANASWFGVFTRAGTPADVLLRLEKGVLDGCAQPEALAKLRDLGAEPTPMGARAMDLFWKSEFAYWKQAITAAGIELN